MSGYNNQSSSYGDDFEHQDGTTGGGLRKALESAIEKINKLEAQLGERARGETAEAVLKDKGLDPALKDLIPADADPKEWVDKYATLLGAKPSAGAESKAEGSEEEPESNASQEVDPALLAEQEALAQIQGAADAGSPAHLTGDVLERMEKIQSEEELLKFFQSNGALADG